MTLAPRPLILRRRELTCTAIIGMFLVARCVTSTRPVIPDGYFLLVSHSSGGPAPFSSDVAFYSDGSVVFRATTGKLTSFRIPRQATRELQARLTSDELLRDIRRLTVMSRDYSDHEQWWFVIRGEEFTFICREMMPTPVVTALIDATRRAIHARIHDEWFMASRCGGGIAG